MYKQSVKNIKLAILPIDGIVFDFNRFRYNYYKHLCEDYNQELDKEQFYYNLSNMYDMYKDLPLSQILDVGPLNSRIERELSTYLHYKGLDPRDGLLEVLEYFHQKEIPVATFTTHRTKDAIEYLNFTRLSHHFEYVIGSDKTYRSLPSSQILEAIIQRFHVLPEETLILSPFLSLNLAAARIHTNIIYVEDIYKPGEKEIATSYKVVNGLFDVLNILLFDPYETTEIYSQILGMDDQMTENGLNNVYDHLKEAYEDDDQVMKIVNQTYEYHLSHLNEKTEKTLNENMDMRKKYFSFNDDYTLEEEPALKETRIAKRAAIENTKTVSNAKIQPLLEEESQELYSLLDQIKEHEEKQQQPKIEKKKGTKQEKANESIEDNESFGVSLLSFVINVFYTCVLSFFIIFVGVLMTVIFQPLFVQHIEPFYTIYIFIEKYCGFIQGCFQMIFNGLHSLIPFVPDYSEYLSLVTTFSNDGLALFHIFLFHILLIAVFKLIWNVIRKPVDEE